MAHDWVPRRICWEGQSQETGWGGPPSKRERARGLGSQIPRSSRAQEVGTSPTRGLDDVLSPSVPPPPSPDHRLSLGPENLSLPPWILGDFEQLVTGLTLHDPNIFGPQ